MKHRILITVVVWAIVVFSCKVCGSDFDISLLPLSFEPQELPPAWVGEFYEVEITVDNNTTAVADFSLSQGDLPAGLSLEWAVDESVAKITGTPEEAGSFAFTISVSCYKDGNGYSQTGSVDYTLVVEE